LANYYDAISHGKEEYAFGIVEEALGGIIVKLNKRLGFFIMFLSIGYVVFGLSYPFMLCLDVLWHDAFILSCLADHLPAGVFGVSLFLLFLVVLFWVYILGLWIFL